MSSGSRLLFVLIISTLGACAADVSGVAPTSGAVISRVDAEPAGAHCTDGGTAVSSGVDADRDGVLDDGEIASTVYVCHHDVVRMAVEPPGAHCASGGTAVQIGDDRNGNDVLDDDEVRDVAYVCATSQHALVTRLDARAADAPCPEGAAIRIGLDLDDDTVLDDGEIMISEYVCGEALQGNLLLETAEDVARAQHVRAVVGDLQIADTNLTEVELPHLWFVGGNTTIRNNPSLTSVRLPSLYEVGRSLMLSSNPIIEEVAVPELRAISGALSVSGNGDHLTALDLDYLRVMDTVTITHNAALGALDWRSVTIVGRIEIASNPKLAALSIEARYPLATVSVHDNAALATAYLEGKTTTASVEVWNNAALHELHLEVGKIGGDLWITDNPKLSRLSGDTVWAGGLQYIADDLHITGSPISDLAICCGGVTVGGDAWLEGLALTHLRSDESDLARVRGNLTLRDNPALTELKVYAEGGLELTNNAALKSAFVIYDQGTSARYLTVVGNPALTSFDAAYVRTVDGDIVISNNLVLPGSGLFGIASAANVSVTDNPRLPACEVESAFAHITALTEYQDGNDTAAHCP
jgi:hypothetical protein